MWPSFLLPTAWSATLLLEYPHLHVVSLLRSMHHGWASGLVNHHVILVVDLFWMSHLGFCCSHVFLLHGLFGTLEPELPVYAQTLISAISLPSQGSVTINGKQAIKM